ncbi:hypothetical protein OROHE_024624 [Orobanche hederae]
MENSRKQSTSSEKEDTSVNSLSLHSLDYSRDFKLHPMSEKSTRYSRSRSSIFSSHSSLVHTMGELRPTPPASDPVANRYVVEEAKPVKKKVDAGGHIGTVQEGRGTGRRFRPPVTSSWQSKRDGVVKKTALGFRVFGFVFSLVSLSVMASDKNQGWAFDSFDRYKEFRYCFSVNIIAFVYSAAQVLNLSIQLATGRSNLLSQYGYFLDFAVDQMIAYLLISSSSYAATRVEDWEMNRGKDKFPQLATTAVATYFLAFAANSLISGYGLCRSLST